MRHRSISPRLRTRASRVAGNGESPADRELSSPTRNRQTREYSQWVKGLKEDGDAGKHYRRIKDDYGRLQAISRLDPKGIDGVRERYAAIDGIAYSEKKGLDAVTAMQSALAESQTALDAIAQGDVDSLSEDTRARDWRAWLLAILDRLAESDADAYTAAVLPHFVEALKGSELASSFNGLVDALNEKPPAWLRPEQKAEWTNDRLSRVLQHADVMGKWFQAQEQRVKEIGKGDGQAKPKLDGQPGEKTEQSATANPQFWKENVYPETNAHAEQAFDKELRQWSDKLSKAGFRLSDSKKTALAGEFVRGLIAESLKNEDYMSQMGRYDRQRTPDKASVTSLFKSEFNRHAARVMEEGSSGAITVKCSISATAPEAAAASCEDFRTNRATKGRKDGQYEAAAERHRLSQDAG